MICTGPQNQFVEKALDEANQDPVFDGTDETSTAIEYLPVKLPQ